MWISVAIASVEPAGAALDPFEDALRGADLVGHRHHVVCALGVHDHLDVGMLRTGLIDVRGPEPLVHRAVALPQ